MKSILSIAFLCTMVSGAASLGPGPASIDSSINPGGPLSSLTTTPDSLPTTGTQTLTPGSSFVSSLSSALSSAAAATSTAPSSSSSTPTSGAIPNGVKVEGLVAGAIAGALAIIL